MLWYPRKQPVIFFAPDGGGNSGGGAAQAANPAAENAGGNGGGAPAAVSYTQAQLDTMFADRANRAEQAAVKKLLEKAGVKDEAEILSALEEGRKAKQSQLTEAEKLQAKIKELEERAAKADGERAMALAQANERLLKSEILAKAAAKGFRPEAIGDVWLVIDRSKITEKDGAFAGIEAAIEQVAKDKPFWLGDGKAGAGKGTPAVKGQTLPVTQPQAGQAGQAARPRLKL